MEMLAEGRQQVNGVLYLEDLPVTVGFTLGIEGLDLGEELIILISYFIHTAVNWHLDQPVICVQSRPIVEVKSKDKHVAIKEIEDRDAS